MKDFYLILQVTRTATPEQIRSAYRRRALELHPDRSGAGGEPFIELQEAYSVLSDPAQRAAYDRQVESLPVPRVGVRRRPAAEPFREVERAGGFREVSLIHSFDAFAPSFDEIFAHLWGNFDLQTQPKAETLESLMVDVPVAGDDAFTGGNVRVLVPARLRCQRCGGRGGIGPYECWRCQGQGFITAEYPVELAYPAGLRRDYVVQVPLDDFGIHNLYLTVRFRPAEPDE
jgi:molecular chaperone DnaJ